MDLDLLVEARRHERIAGQQLLDSARDSSASVATVPAQREPSSESSGPHTITRSA